MTGQDSRSERRFSFARAGGWRSKDQRRTNCCFRMATGKGWISLRWVIASSSAVAPGCGAIRMRIAWQAARRRLTVDTIAAEAGVGRDAVLYRVYEAERPHSTNSKLNTLVAEFNAERQAMSRMQNHRRPVSIPGEVGTEFAAFLGYLIGDGHISETKRVIGLTTGDEEQADRFAGLVTQLFGVEPRKKWDARRVPRALQLRRCEGSAQASGSEDRRCAREKDVPEVILRSPGAVVASFLRAYFDCDGYAGKQGVILATSSPTMSRTVQILLLNFGILSSRRPHSNT